MKNSERLDAIEGRLGIINRELGELCGSQKASVNLIKYVILPLILILGGLIGMKLW